jgi:tetratricopeptide (TPR) repeat protein
VSTDPLDEAAALHEQSTVMLAEHRTAEAELLARRALALLHTHGDPAGADAPDTTNVLLNLAAVRRQAGDLTEAETLGRDALARCEPWPCDGDVLDRLRIHALQGLGITLLSAGRYEEAGTVLRFGREEAERRLGLDDADVGVCCNALGMLGKYTGQFKDAETHYERAMTIATSSDSYDDLQVATIWHNIGGLRHASGRAAEAEEPARRAYELRSAALGRDHPDALADGAALAAVLLDLDRYDEAEVLLERARAGFEDRHGSHHYEVAVCLHGLATASYARGDLSSAERRWAEALAIKEDVLGHEHPELALTLNNLGVVHHDRGRLAEARAAWQRSLSVLTGVGPDHPARRAAESNLAGLSHRG